MQKNTQAQWSNQKQTVIKRLELRLSEATKRVLGSQEEWEKFLAVSSRFIKYPFHQQIQIYDQRPDATAVADNKIWEERLGLRYKPGTHGFQVIDKRDKDNPVVRRYHDIADVREHRKDSKIPKLFTFPLEYTGEVVNRIAGMGREKESPEVSLWKWIGEKTEIYYAEELLETLSDKGLALQVESQNNVDDDQKAEALRKYMQAMVSFQVFSRCGLNIQLCKNMNRELLEGNLYGRSVLAASTEETVGFFGDTVSLASESVFNIISNACEVVSKEITTEKNISQNKESVQDNPETSKEISKEPEREEPSHILSNPLTDQPITREGNTITIGRGDSYHEIDVELLEDMLEALPTTVRIDGHPCAKVDEWTDSDGYSYVLGTSVEDASFSYLAVGGESFEFDYLPTREEAESHYIDFIAEQDINRHEAELEGTETAEERSDFEPEKGTAEPQTPAENFRIIDDHLGEGSVKEKFYNNLAAISVLHQIERGKRHATIEEQQILSQYVGWGGLQEAFDESKSNWKTEYEQLKMELTPDEYKSARGSILNSHYTSPTVIRAIYGALSQLGFKTGNVLEPSCGTGNFFGMLPDSMKESRLFGVELDDVSGRIAQQLYPEARITISGYEKTKFPNNFFDIVVGNVPFGDYKVADRAYDKYNFMIHDYFIAKGLDQLRPGGIMAVITSSGTMDKINSHARTYFAERAHLLGAIRLPDNAFKANAGTTVTTDVLFFQKNNGTPEPNPLWLHSKKNIPDDAPLMVGDIVSYTSVYWDKTQRKIISEESECTILSKKTDPHNEMVFCKIKGITEEADIETVLESNLRLIQRGEPTYTCNQYFQEHPEMVLGKLTVESGPFGEKLTCRDIEDGNSLQEKFSHAAANIKGQILPAYVEKRETEEKTEETIAADPSIKNYSYAVINDEIYFRQDSLCYKQNFSGEGKARVRALIDLKEAGYALLNMELEDRSNDAIQGQMRLLNEKYDRFVASYGRINSKENQIFRPDASSGFVRALEVCSDDGKFSRKADLFSKRTVTPHIRIESVESANEALVASLSEKGQVDLNYMAKLMGNGESPETVVSKLHGIIFRDPAQIREDDAYSGYVTADAYLSGNIRNKLNIAREMAQHDTEYQLNVERLEEAMPKPLEAVEIDVRLGATWIKPEYVEAFMQEKFQIPQWRFSATISKADDVRVSYDPVSVEWHINNKRIGKDMPLAVSKYGTKRKNGLEILENSLNLRDSKVYDRVLDADGREKSVLNKKETTLCNTKAEQIKSDFESWIFNDPERRADLVKTYNEQFNNARSRSFDGSFLQFPGMNPEVNLRSHQKNAVARTLFGGNTLLAHVVGAGKTYTMAASAMEAKRIGISHKSLFVVPNHLTEQWGNEFLALYPAANILVARKEDFLPDKRKMFCSKIATGDYDAVIIGHSQFERIPLSPERQRYYVEKQIDAITKTIAEAKEQKGEAFTIKHLEKTQKKLSAKLEKLNSTVQKDDVVTFEQLGIDRLYVDESHYYKNLYLYTKMSNVAGVQQTEAGKSYDMYMKCQYIDEITKGKGITFATGTPISNSMTELYTNMRYLQAGLLKDYGLDQFDAWAANFGNVVTAVELAPEGSGYRAKKRFSSFFNIPELMNLWHEAADVQTADMLNLPVPKAHVFNVQTQPSKLQKDMVAALSDRADAIRNQKVEPSEDNMLKVTNDGRKLALDQRLIHPDMPDMENSKVNTCVNIAFSIWERTKSQHSTQMIFCDLSTPKEDGSFNVYDDIKEKLIVKGIPVKEIAFIHEAKTEVQKERLFAKVRKGEIRFLIGSTLKMGAGTNVQDHLIALHHLDVPWRPSDIEQREGRIVRQGNLNPEVEIYRYVTVDTFDAYIWQLIENKQKFISQVMTSNSPVRKCADVDDSALSYAEVKALATGNPELKEKMELDISVAKLKLERAAYESEHYHLQDECTFRLPEKIAALKARIKGMENDIAYFQEHKPSDTQQFSINVENQVYTERAAAAEALIAAARKNCTFYSKAVEVGNYIGWPLNARMEYGGGGADKYTLTIQGKVAHQFDMSQNAAANLANMTRILNMMPERLEKLETDYKDTVQALEAAKAEAERPFEKEELYQEQLMRLKELDEKLNISENADSALMAAAEEPENNNPTEFVDFGSLDEKMERWNVFENYQSEQYEDTGEALPKAEIAEVNTKDVDETKENQDTQNQEDKIEESKEERNRDKESKYQLEFSTLGNGITVWNRLAPIVSSPLDKQHMVADYETVAYISPDGKIVTFFEDKNKLPMEVCNQITEKAKEQEERYDPKQVKVASVEGSKDISNKPAEEILNLPGIENAKFMSEGFYRRYPAHGIDSGDFYSVGTSSYNEALDLYLSVETDSDRFAKLYVIAKNESAAQNIYQISEEQAEYLAYHEVLHKYGQEETLIEPMVKIGWSESAAFQDGEVLSLHEAEIRFAAYDEAQNEIRDYAGEDDEFNFGYYEKTKFYVIWETSGKLSYYEGRYDLGDGDGGLLNHIYESQRYDAEEDKSFAARASIYGQDEAIRYKNAAQDFINRTLPVLQTYLRYEIKATEPDNPKTEYQIFDRFAKQMSEEKYIYFNSPKEAKEYLESNTGSVQDMLQHHVVQETQIEKEKDAFLREKIEIALSMYYSERDKILKLADTMGYIPDTNGKMQRILALEDSDEKAGEALQKVENKFSYIANGKTIAEGLTLEQALLKYVIDYSMGAKGNYEIMHDSTCPINFVKNVRGKLVMPVEEIDKYFSLNQQPDFRKVLSTAAGKVQMLHVADPYNALQLPFDQYAAHESDNPWKNPNAMYSIAGIHMTEYQRQQLDDLNHECGHFLSSDEVRLIASGKSEKLHGNLQDSPAIRKKAEELEEVTSKFKIYTEENNYHERDMEENLCAE